MLIGDISSFFEDYFQNNTTNIGNPFDEFDDAVDNNVEDDDGYYNISIMTDDKAVNDNIEDDNIENDDDYLNIYINMDDSNHEKKCIDSDNDNMADDNVENDDDYFNVYINMDDSNHEKKCIDSDNDNMADDKAVNDNIEDDNIENDDDYLNIYINMDDSNHEKKCIDSVNVDSECDEVNSIGIITHSGDTDDDKKNIVINTCKTGNEKISCDVKQEEKKSEQSDVEIVNNQESEYPEKILISETLDSNGGKNKNLGFQRLTDRLIECGRLRWIDGVLYAYCDPFFVVVTQNNAISILKQNMTDEEKNAIYFPCYKNVFENIFTEKISKFNFFDRANPTMLFKNGAYNILTDEKLCISPELFVRYSIDATYYPDQLEYNTPTMDQFILSSCGDCEGLYDLFWTAIAYLLIPEMKGKKIIVFGTAKHTGKSCISNFLERLYGDEFCSHAEIHSHNNSFVYEPLLGSALNTCMDIAATPLTEREVSLLKGLTGGDKITMNMKYRSQFTYRPFCKMLIGTNAPIKLRHYDEAFWDRVEIIPFVNSISAKDQDPELDKKLWYEKDEIVGKAMQYAKELINRNFCFPTCPLSQEMKSEWMDNSDNLVSTFIEEFCKKECDSFSSSAEIYSAYLRFCEKYSFCPIKSEEFYVLFAKSVRLKKARRKMADGSYIRGYIGITIIK